MGKYEREALQSEHRHLKEMAAVRPLSQMEGRRLDEIEKQLGVGQFAPAPGPAIKGPQMLPSKREP